MASAPAEAMAIDPWLNVSCPVNQYWTEAQKKFRRWAIEGKRIGWSGQDGTKDGWYTPLGQYQTTFGSQRVNYVNIDAAT